MDIRNKLSVRKYRVITAIGMAVGAPIISLAVAATAPDAVKYMSEAAKYTPVPISSDNADFSNGSLILYKPSVQPAPISSESDVQNITDEQEDEQAALLIRNISQAHEDLTVFSNESGIINEKTFTSNGGPDFISLPGGGQVRNCTELSNESVAEESLKPCGINLELYSEEPQVLIIHTHTSESYEPSEKAYYDEDYTCRSSDPDNSVVAVGAAMAEELASGGIAVLHDGTIHDAQYTGSYDRSLATTERLLAEFPSIKIILDVHRDAIEEQDGTRISAITEINGEKAAQVMIISAADDGNYNMPYYLENFHFACALQQAIESRYPTLTRPVLFQYCQYNQQLSTGSLLIEVGSHGNSVDQAVYSGRLVGRSLASMFNETVSEIHSNMPRFFLDKLR